MGQDRKLRQVSMEISEVLKKHDVMGAIIISNGEGEGEFILNFPDPTWSQFALSEKSGSIVFKGRFKDPAEAVKTNRTINALWIIKDLLAVKALECRQLGNQLKEKFDIQEDANKKFFRANGDVHDTYKPEDLQG